MSSFNDIEKAYYDQVSCENDSAIGYGLVPNYRRIVALGNNPDVDNATAPEDVMSQGGLFTFPPSAAATEVVSSSANDTAAGTGVQTIRVLGLDANYNEIQEDVSLNGTTPVALVNQYLRVNSAFSLTSGSGHINAGTITVRQTVGPVTLIVIPIGYGQSRTSLYTVPAGYTLQVKSILGCINRNTAAAVYYATVATVFRTSNGNVRLPLEFSFSSNTPYRHEGDPGLIITEKMDFMMRCTNVAQDNTDVTAAWLGVLKKNVII
jgi:hypothetical protein